MVKNKCLNKIKHEKVKLAFQLQNNHGSVIDDDIEKAISMQESAVLLHKAINSLDQRKKQILELSLKGLPNDIIAERLDIALATVKSLKWKAYKTLRGRLIKRL